MSAPKTMKIDDVEYVRADSLSAQPTAKDSEPKLEDLIGQRVTLFCAVYIYTGDLVGVSDQCAKLRNAAIVYETGPFNTKDWKDAQKLPNDHYVQAGLIESFCVLK